MTYSERLDEVSARIDRARELLPDVPPIILPGSEGYWNAYDYGSELEKAFPGQAASDLCYGASENERPEQWNSGIRFLTCTQFGENGDLSWVWEMTFGDGSRWEVEGWCDYTGWDCQSGMHWEEIK